MNTTSFFSKFSKTLLLGFTVFTLIFSGCVDEGVESTSGTGEGDLVISLTDAEGDFTTYTVDVTSITLTKQNGAEVSTLPLSTTVDFAQYTEMTEF